MAKVYFFWTQINSFNLKNEHYNSISRHKTFGGVSFLLFTFFGPFCYEIDHHIFRHVEFVSIWGSCPVFRLHSNDTGVSGLLFSDFL